MTASQYHCICDPNDLFEETSPIPVAVEGCPAHRARRAAQQLHLRLSTTERRICGTEHEPDGERCLGWLTFAPDEIQARCPVCGAWTGRLARATTRQENTT